MSCLPPYCMCCSIVAIIHTGWSQWSGQRAKEEATHSDRLGGILVFNRGTRVNEQIPNSWISNKVRDTIRNCGLTFGNRAPLVNIDECQVFFVVFVVVVNYKKNLWKVADSLFGWTDFRESYGNNLWSWLVAALTPKYLKHCPRSMVTVITSGFTLPVPLWVRNRFAESAVGTLSLSVSICNFIPSFSNPWSEKRRH